MVNVVARAYNGSLGLSTQKGLRAEAKGVLQSFAVFLLKLKKSL